MGWIVGRCGCILAHDHPGRASGSFLAVGDPAGPRFDLAVIEVLFLGLILIPWFAFLDSRKRPSGFWLGIFLTTYGAFRLCLDTLHVSPPRYGPVSVDQWAYGTVLLLGLAILLPATRKIALE
jgi:phosphatidylglycerol:prolipoprotein diacylglycerol transferase